ncbi:MAG: carboxypeptidase regulatory-like domain-containing protein [Gemmatimonadaceae bacterium]
MNARLAIFAGLLVPVCVAAQQPTDTALTAAGRTIVGIVNDTSDRRIDSAEVYIPSLRRRASAGADGTFRFDNIKPGTYEVAARRLGYYPQVRTVIVTKESGAVARFALVPYVRSLPPIVSSSRRVGLSGVIGDTAYGALKDVEVSVVGGGRRARSDSTGSFYLEVHPGRHIIRVKHAGYASQLVTVTVPKDSGRRMLVLLKPTLRDNSFAEEVAMDELAMRLARRNVVYSALYTREDINKGGWAELSEVAQAGAGRKVDPSCLAIVDGGPKREFIWALRASEIEGVEVYRARPRRVQVRSISGGGRVIAGNMPIGRIPQPDDNCQDEVYVWLRK